MPRFIDADNLWSDIMMLPHNGDMISSEEVEQAIKDAPTVDTVEVVRCKDCTHWLPEEPERCKALKQEPYGLCNRYPQRTDWQDTTDHDDFCSYGERKDNDL